MIDETLLIMAQEKIAHLENLLSRKEEINREKIAEMLEQDALATGHIFTDAADVFMRPTQETDYLGSTSSGEVDDSSRPTSPISWRAFCRDQVKIFLTMPMDLGLMVLKKSGLRWSIPSAISAACFPAR